MASSGKSFDDAVIAVSNDGGSTWNDVPEVTDFDPGFDVSNIDMSNIDSTWAQRIAGKKDASPSLTANQVPGDTAHENIMDAFFNDTTLQLRFRPFGESSGDLQFTIPVLVSSLSPPSGTQGDKSEFSADFELQDSATKGTVP